MQGVSLFQCFPLSRLLPSAGHHADVYGTFWALCSEFDGIIWCFWQLFTTCGDDTWPEDSGHKDVWPAGGLLINAANKAKCIHQQHYQ